METKPEIWGGIECTVNRVGQAYFDQLQWNGHADREEDLELFSELGLQTLRYPLLWERIAPRSLAEPDWTWADRRMESFRALNLRPVAGLLHHGSGPAYTDLLDPEFPEKLAAYARAVAERYPWIDAYTPVNEPLTTARFSGLYGYWYPHGKKDASFARALVNQARGVQLAMAAVRRVNPAAQLVQTEDLGKTFSTPALDYQADFDNTRRWLSLDLLVGRVHKKHSLYSYLTWAGVQEAELAALAEAPCPPDIVGLNYYVTSERFLDERLERYPANTRGGNGSHRYADVEVVRVCPEGLAGVGSLLQEAWERYRLPLAVTEVHIGSTREEQLRWLMEIWTQVLETGQKGVDIRAMVVWSLLGIFNWHCLVRRDEGHYESGVFDLRSTPPRPTALAEAVRTLTRGEAFTHPVLDTPGWWRRPGRLIYPPTSRRDEFAYRRAAGAKNLPAAQPEPENSTNRRMLNAGREKPARILITGATGTLGRAFARICEGRGLAYHLTSRAELDITDPVGVERVLDEIRPWAVINTAGYVRVDEAEREPDLCRRVNTDGPAILAQACSRRGLQLLTFSTDLVFDGSQFQPYVESQSPAPLNVYGLTKAEAEALILNNDPSALIVRTSAFFSPWDPYNFPTLALQSLQAGRDFPAAVDLYISPTFVPDLVHASLDLLIDGETGIRHLANRGEISWYEFARLAAATAGLDPSGIKACPHETLGLAAPRPRYSALGSERGFLLPPLEDAVSRCYSPLRAG